MESEQTERAAQPVETEALRKKAADFLVRRAKTTGQMRTKLIAWGADEAQQEEILTWLQEVGLLNDAAYAQRLVDYYTARGYGRYRLRAEMQCRQVPYALWEEALANVSIPSETVDVLLKKKLTNPNNPTQVRRATAALIRRGFTWEEIASAVERLRRECPSDETPL